jgi:hypothetical protein
MALGPTQPPIQWVPGALSLGVKWPGREADHSPPGQRKSGAVLPLHQYASMVWYSVKSTGTTLPIPLPLPLPLLSLSPSGRENIFTTKENDKEIYWFLCYNEMWEVTFYVNLKE